MNKLYDMLQEAFEAGQDHATDYEHGSREYYPDFKKWVEQNQKEITELYNFIKKAADMESNGFH